MSFDTTVRTVMKWTDDVSGQTEELAIEYTLSSVAFSKKRIGQSDNSGWDTLYDASTENTDPGDAPFGFAIKVTSAAAAVLKITDDQGTPVITYVNIPAGGGHIIGFDVQGSTATARIEQIDIQAKTATDCKYEWVVQHD